MPSTELKTQARNELFSHINRCGVLDANPEDQEEWMAETIQYFAERFPDLGQSVLDELQQIGIRYCRPAIPHGGVRSGQDDMKKAEADANAA